MANLMPIGRFARACRLTVKALRHYDDLGLIAPARVDPRTGYRYYAPEQARSAVLVAMLRSLDVPLPVIRELIAKPASAAAVLEQEGARLRREIEHRKRALAAIDHLAQAGALLPYEIRVRREPRRIVACVDRAYVHGEAGADSLEAITTAQVRALLADVEQRGLAWREPVQCLLWPDGEDMHFRVCATLDGASEPQIAADRAPLDPGAEPRIGELAEATCAWALHEGAYEALGLAHHALHAWAQERGHEPAGPIREIYVNDPDEVAPSGLLTEVLLPIEGETP